MHSYDPVLVSEVHRDKKIIRIFRMPLFAAGIQLARIGEEPPFTNEELNAVFERTMRLAICAASRLERASSILIMFIIDNEDSTNQIFEFFISPLIDQMADLVLPYPQESVDQQGVCHDPTVLFRAFDSMPPPSDTEKKCVGN